MFTKSRGEVIECQGFKMVHRAREEVAMHDVPQMFVYLSVSAETP